MCGRDRYVPATGARVSAIAVTLGREGETQDTQEQAGRAGWLEGTPRHPALRLQQIVQQGCSAPHHSNPTLDAIHLLRIFPSIATTIGNLGCGIPAKPLRLLEQVSVLMGPKSRQRSHPTCSFAKRGVGVAQVEATN
ncbi:hypothetical protein EV182_002367 [Spiromyces aspiralis]|uniref:Uncharacterized protein n=1 Tax=Spiromyces aspiralis TaxID=68401 RepID=A0ACC1HS69_9FUNG|nr:hypothetical protein EV182_002367 [Spiromyces aspiralis]